MSTNLHAKYTIESELIINDAVALARSKNSPFVSLEHLLFVLTLNPSIEKVLLALSIDVDQLRAQVDEHIENVGTLQPGHRLAENEAFFNLRNYVIAQYVLNQQRTWIDPTDLLMCIYTFNHSIAFALLDQYATRDEMAREIQDQISSGNMAYSQDVSGGINQSRKQGNAKKSNPYLINLNEKAKVSKVDPVIGREKEIDRVVHVLSKRKKNNVILVGEPGVGKTAVVEGVAKEIVERKIHEALKDKVIYSLDLGALTAGTKFRGEFEQRLKDVMKIVSSDPNAILFIDEIHTIIGSGASSGGGDAANLLKPMLASGEISCIGATTYKEYRNVFEKDAALSRRFDKLDIEEPSSYDSIKIINGLKEYYEKHHGVTYDNKAISTAVELAVKHITHKFLPDKAIDVIDEAGVAVKLDKNNKDKVVTAEVVEKVIAKIARLPEKTVVGTDKDKLKNLKTDLSNVIFGQDEAVSKVVRSIQLARSGLRNANKPIASLMFAGPTGVGKTELTKQVAQSLGYNLVRFDMSEYASAHEVSKFIGAPPGYVGFDQEGALTQAVIKNPSSIILLDEVEKAHPQILTILLQIMDHGTLTDNYGKKADFRQAIIVMTTNAGTTESTAKVMGIAGKVANEKPTQELERTFAPEFRNRLDALIWFNTLDEKNIRSVLDKNLLALQAMLDLKKVSVEYSEEAKQWLAKEGFDPAMGARPMARLIEDQLAVPLSEEILFGKLENGGKAKVDVADDKIVFKFTPIKVKQVKGSEKKTEKVPLQE